MLPYGIINFNTFRQRQDGHHFPDDIFKWVILNENVWISLNISLKFVPKGPINNIQALVQKIAWRRPGDKPLFEPMMVSLLTHICLTQPQWVKTHKDITHSQYTLRNVHKAHALLCLLKFWCCFILPMSFHVTAETCRTLQELCSWFEHCQFYPAHSSQNLIPLNYTVTWLIIYHCCW